MRVSLNDVIQTLESGSRPKGGVKNGSIGIPSLGAEHLDNTGSFKFQKIKYVPESFFDGQKKGIIHEEDILLVKDGATTGKVSFVGSDFLFKKASINEHLFRISVNKEKVIPKYIFWHLFSNTGLKQVLKDFRGATVGGISRGFTKNVLFPLPSLNEQKRIVENIDQVERLGQKRKESHMLLNEYVKSTFFEMFGDPIKNQKGWNTEPLAKIAKLERGRFSPRPRNDPSYFGGKYPFIQTGDISNSNHRLKAFTQTLNEKGIKVSKQFFKDDIVIAIVGATIGVTAILEIDVYATDSVICIKPIDTVMNNIYLEYTLRFWRVILLRNAPESARPNINLNILNKLQIILPPIQLQKQFANIMLQAESISKGMAAQEEMLETQFHALMQKSFQQSNYEN